MLSRALRGSVLATGLWASMSGCATFWGIDEGSDLPDGSAAPGELDVRSAPDSSSAADGGQPPGPPCAAPFTCIPQLPPGRWEGPYAIIEGPGSTALPDCPSDTYPQRVYDGTGAPSAPAATCGCACGAPAGGVCAAPSLSYVTKNGCGPCAPVGPPISLDGGCVPVAFPGGQCSLGSITASVATGGGCPPIASTTVPPATWGTATRLCAQGSPPASATCAAGQVCVPAVTLPVETETHCIAIAAQVACPIEYYTVSRATFQGQQDTRGCSPCTCGPPANAACPEPATAYSDTNCTQVRGTVALPAPCSALGGAKALSFDGGAPSGGACTPSGGQPNGEFKPTSAYTICCDK